MEEKIFNVLQTIKLQYQSLQKKQDLALKDNLIEEYTRLSKELNRVYKLVQIFDEYQKLKHEYEYLKNITDSEEEKSELFFLAKTEIALLQEKIITTETVAIKTLINSTDSEVENTNTVIMEIHGAVGGEEANIFVADLFKMYTTYFSNQKWRYHVTDSQASQQEGFSRIIFTVKGKNCYRLLQFESGAHRVQRVPKTESKGRVHTSVAVVAVLPKISKEIKIEIKPNDIRIDTYRASSAGGQHVNKTDSAVRITHLPTGIVCQAQDNRSQTANKETALTHLRAKLYLKEQSEINANISSMRKAALGSGDRSEKIRTYNWPQNRITDHRINLTLNKLDSIIKGNLDDIISALQNHYESKKLKLFLGNIK